MSDSDSEQPNKAKAAAGASGSNSSYGSTSSSSYLSSRDKPPPDVPVNVSDRLYNDVLHSFQRSGVQYCLHRKGRAMVRDIPNQ